MKQGECNLTTGFSGPKLSRDSRETGTRSSSYLVRALRTDEDTMENVHVGHSRSFCITRSNLVCCYPQNSMSVRLPSTIQGGFVLTASYFHNYDDQGILNLVVRAGDEVFRAKMKILSCR